MEKQKQVFISYTHKDGSIAQDIASIYASFGLKVWIDFSSLQPGEFISRRIEDGVSSSNYFTILISETSVRSKWVQAELAMAFDLSRDGRLVLLPAKIEDVDMPLELRGLMYLDFSKSFDEGKSSLLEFLKSEGKSGREFFRTTRYGLREGGNCEHRLFNLPIPDLRYEISKRLTKDELSVVWFDTFETVMNNDINPASTGVIASELIHRAQSRRRMDKLIRHLCRERPDLERT